MNGRQQKTRSTASSSDRKRRQGNSQGGGVDLFALMLSVGRAVGFDFAFDWYMQQLARSREKKAAAKLAAKSAPAAKPAKKSPSSRQHSGRGTGFSASGVAVVRPGTQGSTQALLLKVLQALLAQSQQPGHAGESAVEHAVQYFLPSWLKKAPPR